MEDLLYQRFLEFFPASQAIAEAQWLKLKAHYGGKNRHYHNLQHLAAMFEGMDHFPQTVTKPLVFVLSIFYHDIIYNPLRKDNEVQSGKYAEKCLLKYTNIAPAAVQEIDQYIKATKLHRLAKHDPDLQLLLDLDLSILGRPRPNYAAYTQQIRKEYWMYPGPLYRKGRKQALTHFLERRAIFGTPYFHDRLEQQARENISWEISQL